MSESEQTYTPSVEHILVRLRSNLEGAPGYTTIEERQDCITVIESLQAELNEAKLDGDRLKNTRTRKPHVVARLEAVTAERDALQEGFQLAANASGYEGDWFDSAPIRALIDENTRLTDIVNRLQGEKC